MNKEIAARIIKEYSLILGWITLSPFLIHMGYLMHDRFLKRKSKMPIFIIIMAAGVLSLFFILWIVLFETPIDFYDFYGTVLFSYSLGILGMVLQGILIELPLISYSILATVYFVPFIFTIIYIYVEDFQTEIDFEEYEEYKRVDGLIDLYESKSSFLLLSNQGHILFYPSMKSIYIKDIISIDVIIDEIVYNDVLSTYREALWNSLSASMNSINLNKKVIHSITVNFTLNDFNNPYIYFPIINKKTAINNYQFKNAQERLIQLITILRLVKEKSYPQ